MDSLFQDSLLLNQIISKSIGARLARDQVPCAAQEGPEGARQREAAHTRATQSSATAFGGAQLVLRSSYARILNLLWERSDQQLGLLQGAFQGAQRPVAPGQLSGVSHALAKPSVGRKAWYAKFINPLMNFSRPEGATALGGSIYCGAC